MENSGAITSDGHDWVKMALDPFHDFNMKIAGLPDKTSGDSVVRFFKKKITITRPYTLPSDSNWDCHIFTMPFIDSVMTTSARVNTYNAITRTTENPPLIAPDSLFQMGTVNVVSGVFDHGAWITDNRGILADELFHVSADMDFPRRSLARVIGCGFEVHNDTPKLYASGSVTCYNAPQGDYHDQMFFSRSLYSDFDHPPVTGDTNCSGPWTVIRRPPDSVSEAMQLHNSVTYKAVDGCYVVARVDLDHADYAFPTNKPIAILGKGSQENVSENRREIVSVWNTPNLSTAPGYCQNYAPFPYTAPDKSYRLTPLHTSGAFFTGLSPQTVLTLETHIVVESLPITNLSELALATPSSVYDPIALQLYERSIRDLKAGVPVSMNAAGDWWKMVGKTLLDAAPDVVGALIPGAGPLIRGAVNMGKKFVSKFDKSEASAQRGLVQNGNIFRTGNSKGKNVRAQATQGHTAQPKKGKKGRKNRAPRVYVAPMD